MGGWWRRKLVFIRTIRIEKNPPPKKNLKSSFSLPFQGEAGGRGVRGEFRPPSQSCAKSVRIFSNTHRSAAEKCADNAIVKKIKKKKELFEAIRYVHFACFALCKKVFGNYLPVSGNIGIFCHYDDEYEFLTRIRKELTDEEDNWNEKYYRLHEPIVIQANGDVGETTYTYLYIRKPDYHTEVGDADFVLEKKKFEELKKRASEKTVVHGVELFYRPDLNMVRLSEANTDALLFVTTKYMTENVGQ